MSQSPMVIHTYKRYWNRWSVTTDTEFFDMKDFHGSEILRNTILMKDYLEENSDLKSDFMNTLDVSNNDPHFPEVKVSGGPKFFTEEEYQDAKNRVANMEKSINDVVDLDGILTTSDAEFDRAMIYQSTDQARRIITSFERDLELAEIVDKLKVNK